MTRNSPERDHDAMSGLTKRAYSAQSAPARPAPAPAMTNATSL